MKTELIKEIIRELFNDFYVSEEEETTWETYLTHKLSELELNAAKWGAEQAAKIANNTTFADSSKKTGWEQAYDTGCLHCEDAIKNFANTLTIDQLPK